MTCNGTLFSVNDLGGESIENEVFISDHCVSNTLKITVFIIYLSINATMIGLAIYSMWWIKEEGRKKWNVFSRTFLGGFIASLCNIGRLVFFITGTASRWKYLLFPFPFIFVACPAIDLGYRWFMASRMNCNMGQATPKEDRKYKLFVAITIVWAIIGYILGAIGPLIFFDNPWIINWFYCFMLVHNNIMALVICCSYIYFGSKFLKDLKQWEVSNKEVNPNGTDTEAIPRIIKSLRNVLIITGPFILPTFLLIVLPIIWISLIQSGYDIGMQYFFYVQFFLMEPFPIVGMASQAYFQLNLPHSSRNNTSQNKKNSDQGSGSTSATVSDSLKKKDSHTEVNINLDILDVV